MKEKRIEPHIVMSINKTNEGIEVREDVAGNVPEISSLMTTYLIILCQRLAERPITTDGKILKPREILMGIVLAQSHRLMFQ